MKLLKGLVISILAVSLVLGIALPALANSKGDVPQPAAVSLKQDDDRGNKDKDKGKVQVITGNVTAINGNVISINGKEIRDVTVNNETRYKVPGVKDATLADIKVGMHIVAQTRAADDGKLVARQIVEVPRRPVPVPVQHTGNVTAFAYDAAVGGNITIQDKAGRTISFEIVAGKFNVRPKGAQVAVGKMVTVIGRRIPSTERLVATAVVVHPAPLQTVTGTITNITEVTADNGTITIGTTLLRFDKNTLVVVRGALGARVGQQATATYREQSDHTLLAKTIRIGVKPPQPKPNVATRIKARAD